MTAKRDSEVSLALTQQSIATLISSLENITGEVRYIRERVDSLWKDFISRDEYQKDLEVRCGLLKEHSDRIDRIDNYKVWKDFFNATLALAAGIIWVVTSYLSSHIKFFQ